MATFNKYQQFVEDLGNKVHDLVGTNDTLKVMLSNTAPNAATHAVRADASELAGGNGYTSGGEDVQNDGTETGGVLTVTGVDVVWTASGAVGPFRYVILYNDTPVSPADPLIGWWDYGAAGVTLASGETFTANFGASLFTIE